MISKFVGKEVGTGNEDMGGDYGRKLGVEYDTHSDKEIAAPNASFTVYASTNNRAAKTGIGAEANALEYKGKDNDVEFRALGVKAGADAEIGAGGIGVGYEAEARLFEGGALGFKAKLAAGVGSRFSLNTTGIEAKIAGTGAAIGLYKVGVIVGGSEFSVNPAKVSEEVVGFFKKLF